MTGSTDRNERSVRKHRGLFTAALFLLIFGTAFLACATAGTDQPNMRAALDELQAARSELQAASSDKGGHRLAAIAIVDDAIREVRQGIRYSERH